MPGEKNTKAMIATRVAVVAQMLLQGAKHAQMWQYVQEKSDWAISERTLVRYTKKARKKIEETANESIAYEHAKAKARLEDLYQKSYTAQDYKTCKDIIVEQIDFGKLRDINPVDPTRSASAPTIIIKRKEDRKIRPDDIDKIIAGENVID